MFSGLKPIFSKVLLGCCAFSAGGALAGSEPVYDLEVQEDLPVHEHPDLSSKILLTLGEGDIVVIASKIYGPFRKVMVQIGGKTTPGYIPKKRIWLSEIHERGSIASKTERPYGGRYSVGIAGVPSYLRQGPSSFQLSDATTYETSEFTSFSFFFSLFLDSPLNEKWGLRSYLSLRETDFSGHVREKDSPAPTPLDTEASRKQSLLGVGLVFKNYAQHPTRWWWGPGLELAMGTKVTVIINDVVLPTDDSDNPFFAIVFGAVGLEYSLFKSNFYFAPDLRMGAIVSTNPMTVYLESFLGLSYMF
jgi:hypothetical protein